MSANVINLGADVAELARRKQLKFVAVAAAAAVLLLVVMTWPRS